MVLDIIVKYIVYGINKLASLAWFLPLLTNGLENSLPNKIFNLIISVSSSLQHLEGTGNNL